jgi:hypothetical protein
MIFCRKNKNNVVKWQQKIAELNIHTGSLSLYEVPAASTVSTSNKLGAREDGGPRLKGGDEKGERGKAMSSPTMMKISPVRRTDRTTALRTNSKPNTSESAKKIKRAGATGMIAKDSSIPDSFEVYRRLNCNK